MNNSRMRKKLKKERTEQVSARSTSPVSHQVHAAGSDGKNASTPRVSSTLLWFSVLTTTLILAYLNPAVITALLDSWIGFSEHYDGAPAATLKTETFAYLPADIPKRDAVVKAFKHSWHAYERDAMGDDEYHPLERKGSNLTGAGGIGYMVIDVLDTMQLMGLNEEYARSRDWVHNKLSFDRDDRFSTFETTIRVLGGLLSAHHLSDHDPIYLEKAVQLADRILPVFNTSSGLPFPVINLATLEPNHTDDFPGLVSIAEAGTLQLEFRYLSHLTGNDVYWRAVEKVMQVIKDARLPHGLASIFLDIDRGQYETSAIRLGARADSFYEYLLKQYLQTNKSELVYREMYDDAMSAVHSYLIQESKNSKMTYTSELIPEHHEGREISWRLTPKQDHLVCFLGGSLMLGATHRGPLTQQPVSIPPQPKELAENGLRDWKTGIELIKTCMNTHDTASGLSPEIVYFRVPSDGMDGYDIAPSDWYIRGAQKGEFPPYDARYMLRPETVESLFLAYRLTGDLIYREHAWGIFQSIEKHCRVPTGGYATIINVDENPARQEDKMETFFLSETLKYLYLLFSDSDVVPLDKYVFNTEAHPLPIFTPAMRTGIS